MLTSDRILHELFDIHKKNPKSYSLLFHFKKSKKDHIFEIFTLSDCYKKYSSNEDSVVTHSHD